MDRIMNYINKNSPVSVNDLKEEFNVSNQMIHRHLKTLTEENKVYKV